MSLGLTVIWPFEVEWFKKKNTFGISLQASCGLFMLVGPCSKSHMWRHGDMLFTNPIEELNLLWLLSFLLKSYILILGFSFCKHSDFISPNLQPSFLVVEARIIIRILPFVGQESWSGMAEYCFISKKKKERRTGCTLLLLFQLVLNVMTWSECDKNVLSRKNSHYLFSIYFLGAENNKDKEPMNQVPSKFTIGEEGFFCSLRY